MKTLLKTTSMALMLLASPAMAQHAGHGGAASAAKAPDWTNYPMLVSAGGYSRTGVKYQAFNMHAMDGLSFASFDGDGETVPQSATQAVPVNDTGELLVTSGQTGGYYLVRAMGHGPNGEEATATTLKYFSNPGAAPRDLLNATRPGFEITPAILPREHGHYRENETWAFRVHLNDKPVANLPVVLQTSNGTRADFISDETGLVQVTFPGDFQDIPKDQWRHGSPPDSHFVLAVQNGGLLATFNGDYSLDAYGDKNLWAGIGFALFGMVLAVPVVRRGKKA